MLVERAQRRGGTTALVCLLLVPLLALVAFAVDLNYLWTADAQLQNAADSAAHAGATRLLGYSVRASQGTTLTGALGGLLGGSGGNSALREEARAAVVERARAYAAQHRAGGDAVELLDGDVELGFVADPSAPPGSLAGRFQTGALAPFPNSVRVTVRRDESVSAGQLRLFFGPVVGTPSSPRRATAIATLNGPNVTGFQGDGSKLLPLGMGSTLSGYLTGIVGAPLGLLKDGYRVTEQLDGGPPPPGNVVKGPDGTWELTFYPTKGLLAPLDLVSLTNSKTINPLTYSNWIRNGPSSADLASFGGSGLLGGGLLSLFTGPAFPPSLLDDLDAIKGQPRVGCVTGAPSLLGIDLLSNLLGFTGMTVVAVDKATEGVTVQAAPVVDRTARLGGGPGPTRGVYRGIVVSR